jgi:hypothetical protein
MEMNHSIHLNSRVGWDRNTDILLYNHPISKFKEFELDKPTPGSVNTVEDSTQSIF